MVRDPRRAADRAARRPSGSSILRAADIAVQPCHTLETLPHDPHLEAVGLIGFEQHPTEGRTAAIRSSLRVDDAYLPRRAPAQPRGADTHELLREMGYAPDAIEALLASGAAQAPARHLSGTSFLCHRKNHDEPHHLCPP